MNSNTSPIVGKKLAWAFTLIYFASYITRRSLSVVFQQVITETGFSKDLLSVILVSSTIAYGAGQIINGKLGDRFRPTNMIFCGLVLTSSVNAALPFFAESVAMMALLWGINGFAQSMLWPPMVKILVSSCDDKTYGYSVVRISWGSSSAMISLYFIAPLIILLTGSWRYLLMVSAVIGFLALIFWSAIKGRILSESPSPSLTDASTEPQRFSMPRTAIFPIIFIMLGIVFHGMLKDGVVTWMPSYLADVHGLGNLGAIFSGILPSVFSILCITACGAIYRRFFSNEVVCATTIFGIALVASVVLILLFGKSSIVAIVCLTLISACMHGVNLMLIMHVPKRFKRYGNISTFAGIVNACTYIGEAIFTYAIAVFVGRFDWFFCTLCIAFIALCGTLLCLISARPWNKFIK